MPILLRQRLFPRHAAANRLPAWRWNLNFDLLAALALGIGTATLGLMGAFALVLVPAWAAFRIALSWTWTLVFCALIGVAAYLGAFAVALALDQPFGAVLVAVGPAGGGAIGALGRLGRGRPSATR